MKLQLFALLSSVAIASASWAKNLNYRSPSENHPGLGIAIHKVVKRSDPSQAWDPAQLNFTHGVASGDPYSDSVILWTRAAPTTDNDRSNVTVSGDAPLFNHDTDVYVEASAHPVCVEWKIATTRCFTHVADSGVVYTSSDIDWTVKIEARNLEAFTNYYYQFNICNADVKSPIGRTKTTPGADQDVSEVKLAVYSCANYPMGFFNVYGNSARKDSVDYVVQLGDYIYEYENGYYGDGTSIGRIPQPDREIYTLYDYRRRHAIYKTDLDLVESHQQYPWIPVWDDHEVADNAYRDGSAELNNTEASFVSDGGVSVDQRKMNAVRAYFEWMPIRQVEMDDNLRIWRSFKIGKLADLIILDTRNYDRSITDLYWNTHYIEQIHDDTGRSLMGSRQENWFYGELKRSSQREATWRIIGSQVVFTHLDLPGALVGSVDATMNLDSWDGYTANRNRTLKTLYDNGIGNNIFIGGDIHTSWVSDLAWQGNEDHPYDPATGQGAVGVEFVGSAVSSPSILGATIDITRANGASELFNAAPRNRELQWNELFYRGYFELRLTPDEATAEYFGTPDIQTRNGLEISLANFTVMAGANSLARPVAGGEVESGSVKGGQRISRNNVFDTYTGEKFQAFAYARARSFHLQLVEDPVISVIHGVSLRRAYPSLCIEQLAGERTIDDNMANQVSSVQLPPAPREIGIFEPYIAKQTETLILKEKMLSLTGDSFDIKLISGQPLVRVDGKFRSLSGRKAVHDLNGQHLFDIHKEHIHLHSTYVVDDAKGNKIMEVKSSFKVIGSKATAVFTSRNGKSETLVMEGSWLDTSADIVDEASGAHIARIDRKLLKGREIFGGQQTYALIVSPGVDMALMAALCICLDEKNNEH
ncbi:hypothetical protein S40293_05065 [Stachybotrys chartarum IBT 40293]|nr:hypothetical protein S40293_05065 [Stachybotrys chartarum IBT 40293]